jgi:hypothetical protein
MDFVRFGVLTPQKQETYGKDTFHAAPCKYGIYAFPESKIEFFLLGATDSVSNPSAKSAWLKDRDGNKIPYDIFYDYHLKITLEDGRIINLPGDDNDMFKGTYYKVLREEYGATDKDIHDVEIVSHPKNEYKPLLRKYNIRKTRYLSSEKIDGVAYVRYLKPPKVIKYKGDIWHHLENYVEEKDVIMKSGSWIKTNMKTYEKAYKKFDATERFNSLIEWKGNRLITTNFKGIPCRATSCYDKDTYEVFIEKIK